MVIEIIALIVLLVIIAVYVIYTRPSPSRFDIFTIVFAYALLVFHYIHYHTQRKAHAAIEGFADSVDTNTQTITKINLEDDIATAYATTAVAYLTAFNKRSYGSTGRTWTNIADPSLIKGGCATTNSAVNWTFDTDPSYTRQTGFTMNTQMITGPLSCALGIECNTPYSMFIAFKPRDITIAGGNEVEIIKLFANATNNTGISLVIPAGTIKSTENGSYVTTGLAVKIADKTYTCSYDLGSVDIPVDKDLLSMLFISKDTESLKVIYMNEKSASQVTLLSVKDSGILANPEINFSNKQLVINNTKNWNVSLMALGIFKAALTNEQMGTLYNKFMGIYKKNKDDEYVTLAQSFNTLADKTKSLEACPYDDKTCGVCGDVTDWKNMIGVLINSSTSCKKAINTYCSTNLADAKCGGCWDTKNTVYNTDACKTTRTMLAMPEDVAGGIIAGFTPAQLESLKSKFPAVAPATTVKTVISPVTMPQHSMIRLRDFYPKGTQVSTGGEVDERDLPGIDTNAGGMRGFFKRLFGSSTPAGPIQD